MPEAWNKEIQYCGKNFRIKSCEKNVDLAFYLKLAAFTLKDTRSTPCSQVPSPAQQLVQLDLCWPSHTQLKHPHSLHPLWHHGHTALPPQVWLQLLALYTGIHTELSPLPRKRFKRNLIRRENRLWWSGTGEGQTWIPTTHELPFLSPHASIFPHFFPKSPRTLYFFLLLLVAWTPIVSLVQSGNTLLLHAMICLTPLENNHPWVIERAAPKG